MYIVSTSRIVAESLINLGETPARFRRFSSARNTHPHTPHTHTVGAAVVGLENPPSDFAYTVPERPFNSSIRRVRPGPLRVNNATSRHPCPDFVFAAREPLRWRPRRHPRRPLPRHRSADPRHTAKPMRVRLTRRGPRTRPCPPSPLSRRLRRRPRRRSDRLT